MNTNYVSEFIHAGQVLEATTQGRALDRAYINLADDIAGDIVDQALSACLEDLLIIDTEGYSYLLDEFEIAKHFKNSISEALLRMAGR